ncbi:MAG: tetratricopeptide repeat protein [Fimbriimonadaceae bacterium]|nr:tetratricopeptide repeat protein [Fimbriimonadaceae bacterium]QYK57450.1 MAG: tetratricopeptide repeat protein [Fimbriimonadaceae bacterium]
MRGLLLTLGALALVGCATDKAVKPAVPDLSSVKSEGSSRANNLIEQAQRQIKSQPEKPGGYNRLGHALMQRARETGNLADYVSARTAFESAVAKAPDDSTSLHNLAWCWTMFHQFDKAIELSDRAIKIDSEDAFAYGVRFDSMMELGRYKEAGQAVQRMLDLKPSLASYSRAAQYRWAVGDGKGAVILLNRAIQAGSPYGENTLWCMTQAADVAFKLGNLQAAEQGYKAALERDSRYRHALFGLGRCLAARGRTDEGMRAMRSALDQSCPPVYRLEYAALLSREGRKTEAATQYSQVEKQVQEHQKHGIEGDEVVLAESWMAQGVRLDEALETMVEEAKHHTNWQTYSALAWAQHKNGQNKAAKASIERAMAVGAQEPHLWARAARIAESDGDLERARTLFASAQNLNQHLATIGYGSHPPSKPGGPKVGASRLP